MQKQKFDEIISYVNKKVSEMEIETKYKMELLGMVTALGYAHEKETHDKRTETHARDCISRQAAFDAINTWDKFGVDERSRIIRWHEGLEPYVHLRDVLTAIVNLPSAQPERKKGSWIEDGYNHYKAVCSECGEPCATYVMGKPRDNFCKWCGADMRGEQNGQ